MPAAAAGAQAGLKIRERGKIALRRYPIRWTAKRMDLEAIADPARPCAGRLRPYGRQRGRQVAGGYIAAAAGNGRRTKRVEIWTVQLFECDALTALSSRKDAGYGGIKRDTSGFPKCLAQGWLGLVRRGSIAGLGAGALEGLDAERFTLLEGGCDLSGSRPPEAFDRYIAARTA